jgi:GDP-mannose 6-dehydrogenase
MSGVGIFGLGYVGAVSAACLADRGHAVVGVDTNRGKVDLVSRHVSPIVEAGMSELVERVVAAGQTAVDLMRIADRTSLNGAYQSVCW